MSRSVPKRLLFVCTGNICRSPLAENLFHSKIIDRKVADHFIIDSAGTGHWHVGEAPDPRMRQTAKRHGIQMAGTARHISKDDFEKFDLLICMDNDNRERLLDIGAPESKVRLLLEWDVSSTLVEVPDPYYGSDDGFETVYKIVDAACDALLDDLLAVRK